MKGNSKDVSGGAFAVAMFKRRSFGKRRFHVRAFREGGVFHSQNVAFHESQVLHHPIREEQRLRRR